MYMVKPNVVRKQLYRASVVEGDALVVSGPLGVRTLLSADYDALPALEQSLWIRTSTVEVTVQHQDIAEECRGFFLQHMKTIRAHLPALGLSTRGVSAGLSTKAMPWARFLAVMLEFGEDPDLVGTHLADVFSTPATAPRRS